MLSLEASNEPQLPLFVEMAHENVRASSAVRCVKRIQRCGVAECLGIRVNWRMDRINVFLYRCGHSGESDGLCQGERWDELIR